VELAHEALITQWPWLQDMLRANAVDVRRLARLMERTKEWSAAPDDAKKSFLAYGADRDVFNELAHQRPDWLSPDDRSLVAKSIEWKTSEARRDWWMTWSLRVIAVALACALVGVGWFYWRAQSQLDRANQAIAQSINNDLDLQPGDALTPRQRSALWQLAAADEPVKSKYVPS
jgi:hypothetical protein